MNQHASAQFTGIFQQLGFSKKQTARLHRAGRYYGDSPVRQLYAIAAASLGYRLDSLAATALETCNRELGIRCEDVRP